MKLQEFFSFLGRDQWTAYTKTHARDNRGREVHPKHPDVASHTILGACIRLGYCESKMAEIMEALRLERYKDAAVGSLEHFRLDTFNDSCSYAEAMAFLRKYDL